MLQEKFDLADRAGGPFAADSCAGLSHFLLVSQDATVRFAADACAEVLQCANRFLTTRQFTWEHGLGLDTLSDRTLPSMARTGLFLVGGTEHPWYTGDTGLSRVKARLQAARHLCVVGSGVFVPLAAGHLDGKCLSVHPNFRVAVCEMAYGVDICNRAVNHSGGLSSAITGMAAASMMLDLIGQRVGRFTQQAVAEYLGLCQPYQGSGSREHWRYLKKSQGNRVIARALDVMLDHLEEVLSAQQIAMAINVSPRHLERCCKGYLGSSPMKVYRNLRLARARQLVVQTNLPITEISMASGFSSVSGFSRWYREKYGEPPAASRKHAFCGA
jgi:AraC family transcriptional regulator, glycine betaine-responsive activator